jgi:hypothetical protein
VGRKSPKIEENGGVKAALGRLWQLPGSFFVSPKKTRCCWQPGPLGGRAITPNPAIPSKTSRDQSQTLLRFYASPFEFRASKDVCSDFVTKASRSDVTTSSGLLCHHRGVIQNERRCVRAVCEGL